MQWEMVALGLATGGCSGGATFEVSKTLLGNKDRSALLGALNNANAWNNPGGTHA